MSHSHLRYAVRLPDGTWIGANRGHDYQRRVASYSVARREEFARLYTREGDATKAAKAAGGEVILAGVTLGEPPLKPFKCPINFPGCMRNCGSYGGCGG